MPLNTLITPSYSPKKKKDMAPACHQDPGSEFGSCQSAAPNSEVQFNSVPLTLNTLTLGKIIDRRNNSALDPVLKPRSRCRRLGRVINNAGASGAAGSGPMVTRSSSNAEQSLRMFRNEAGRTVVRHTKYNRADPMELSPQDNVAVMRRVLKFENLSLG